MQNKRTTYFTWIYRENHHDWNSTANTRFYFFSEQPVATKASFMWKLLAMHTITTLQGKLIGLFNGISRRESSTELISWVTDGRKISLDEIHIWDREQHYSLGHTKHTDWLNRFSETNKLARCCNTFHSASDIIRITGRRRRRTHQTRF